MTYELWIKLYKEAMELLSVIGSSCPFVNDNSVSCYSCKINNKCNFVREISVIKPE